MLAWGVGSGRENQDGRERENQDGWEREIQDGQERQNQDELERDPIHVRFCLKKTCSKREPQQHFLKDINITGDV